MSFFLFGCIPARTGLAALPLILPEPYLKVLAIIAAIISTGFLTIYMFGWRKQGIETRGKPIYWNYIRPIHSLVYAGIAYVLWNGNRKGATALLLVDIVIGILVHLHHRGIILHE